MLAETEDRKDDDLKTVEKRLNTHRTQCQPVIDHFLGVRANQVSCESLVENGETNVIYFKDDGNGSIESVFETIQSNFMNSHVFVLGPPGAGKGTQCANLVNHFKGRVTHLSAGDLLRAERNSGSENGDMINTMIKNGEIVPAHITVGLLRRAMINDPNSTFLIDGFPRNEENLTVWDEIMGEESFCHFLLYLTITEEDVTKRLLNRGKTSGRVDDNKESIIKRLNTYNTSTVDIINRFDEMGKKREIDSSLTIDQVFQSILPLFSATDEEEEEDEEEKNNI